MSTPRRWLFGGEKLQALWPALTAVCMLARVRRQGEHLSEVR